MFMLGDTVPFIDIIIFAIIAVLLVLRLRSVLGQRTGYEEKQPQKSNFDTAAADVIPIDSGRKPRPAMVTGSTRCARQTSSFQKSSSLRVPPWRSI